MNDSIQNETPIITDGKVSLDDYKIYRRTQSLKDLPNIISFGELLRAARCFLPSRCAMIRD
jgi:hypothetical protein